jgi:DNA-directed RNA polymerase beta subunit
MSSIVSTLKKIDNGRHTIYEFGHIAEAMEVPYLLETQKKSYSDFLQKEVPPAERRNLGLQEAFTSVFPSGRRRTPRRSNLSSTASVCRSTRFGSAPNGA